MLHRFEDHRLLDLVDRHAADGWQHVALGLGRLHVDRLSEGGGVKDAGLAHQHGTLDRLPQLADVSRPRLRHEIAHRIVASIGADSRPYACAYGLHEARREDAEYRRAARAAAAGAA